jgi:hypothetical protein
MPSLNEVFSVYIKEGSSSNVLSKVNTLFEDVNDRFLSTESILSVFKGFGIGFKAQYKDCYIDLSIPNLLELPLKKEIVETNFLLDINYSIEANPWFSSLINFESDEDLPGLVIKNQYVPILAEFLKVCDLSNAKLVKKRLQECLDFFSPQSEVVSRLKSQLKDRIDREETYQLIFRQVYKDFL